MFKEAKKLLRDITHHASDCETKKRAVGAIELGVNLIYRDLERVPQNRVPCPKIAKSIQKLRLKIDEILAPVGIIHTDLAESRVIDDVEVARANLTMERYASLIQKSDEVNPFGSLYEIYHAIENVNLSINESTELLFKDAIRSLFMHREFPNCLIEKIYKKIDLLSEKPTVGNELLHFKLHLFLRNYPAYKQFSSKLRDNEVIDSLLKELEAALYFEEEMELIQSGQTIETETFVPFMNQWVSYLSHMDESEQNKHRALIRIIDKCSEEYNHSLEK